MALQELQAMQAAYELLSPLDPSAQQRALTWLSAALADTKDAPAVADEPATPVKHVIDAPADNTSPKGAADATRGSTATESPVAAEPGPVAEPKPVPRPQRGRSARTTGRRAADAVVSPVPATSAQAKPGRRGARPSGEQFLSDLAAVGSFKELAEKYGKSIGTIGNWANQLREQGFDIPVGRLKKA